MQNCPREVQTICLCPGAAGSPPRLLSGWARSPCALQLQGKDILNGVWTRTRAHSGFRLPSPPSQCALLHGIQHPKLQVLVFTSRGPRVRRWVCTRVRLPMPRGHSLLEGGLEPPAVIADARGHFHSPGPAWRVPAVALRPEVCPGSQLASRGLLSAGGRSVEGTHFTRVTAHRTSWSSSRNKHPQKGRKMAK